MAGREKKYELKKNHIHLSNSLLFVLKNFKFLIQTIFSLQNLFFLSKYIFFFVPLTLAARGSRTSPPPPPLQKKNFATATVCYIPALLIFLDVKTLIKFVESMYIYYGAPQYSMSSRHWLLLSLKQRTNN